MIGSAGTAPSGVLAWLCGDHADHARFMDMQARFRKPWVVTLSVGGTTLVTSRWDGWRLIALVVAASVIMAAASRIGGRIRRPEIAGVVAFTLLEVDIALTVYFSGGAKSPLLPLLVIPVFSQAVCFRPAVTRCGVVLSALLAAAVVFGSPPARRPPEAVNLLAFLGLLASLALAAYFLADADLTSRADAVIDPLTGLFNRKALQSRFAEVRAQALALDLPVAVAMGDLDHFKTINDVHGHDRGDTVLQEVAYRLRKTLRTYDLVYRLGGEEFFVLLPGSDDEVAQAMAERLRGDISATPIAGIAVTMSIGVSSGQGSHITLAALMKAADEALYEAKRGGRDRVVVAGRSPAARVGS